MSGDFGILIPASIRHQNQYDWLNQIIIQLSTLYPSAPVVVIDDGSTSPLNLNLPNVTVIKPDTYKGAGEMLPYYLLWNNRWFKKALIIHDNVYLKRQIDIDGINDVRFLKTAINHREHWHINLAPITDYNKKHGIYNHDDEILDFLKRAYKPDHPFYQHAMDIYHDKNAWVVCFGCQSVITLDFLDRLHKSTDILNVMPLVTTRRERMVMESLMGIACIYMGLPIEHSSCCGYWLNMIGDSEKGYEDAYLIKKSFGR